MDAYDKKGHAIARRSVHSLIRNASKCNQSKLSYFARPPILSTDSTHTCFQKEYPPNSFISFYLAVPRKQWKRATFSIRRYRQTYSCPLIVASRAAYVYCFVSSAVNGWRRLWFKKFHCFIHVHEHGRQNSSVTTIRMELLSYTFGKILTNRNKMPTMFLASSDWHSAIQLPPCKKKICPIKNLLICFFFTTWIDKYRLRYYLRSRYYSSNVVAEVYSRKIFLLV